MRRRHAPERGEGFIDMVNITSLTGTMALGTNRPTQNPSSPVIRSTVGAPDTDINHNVGSYNTALYDPNTGVTKIWYTTWPESGSGTGGVTHVGLGYGESTDGVTFTRPNLGLCEYPWGSGSYNNNLCGDGTLRQNFYHGAYDATRSAPYLFLVSSTNLSLPMNMHIYESTDGLSMTRIKTITAAEADPSGAGWCEPRSLYKRTDGRWVITFQKVIASPLTRSMAMLLGPADGSLTGTWTPMGEVIGATFTRQIYMESTWVNGDYVYCLAGLYEGNTAGTAPVVPFNTKYDRIWTIALYTGRADDGTVLTLRDEGFLPSSGPTNGSGGISDPALRPWDYSEVISGNSLVEVGDEWRLYYGGDTNPHHTYDYAGGEPEGDRFTGLATIGRGRIGKVSGSGTVVLRKVSGSTSGRLTINTASGAVKVELLNPVTGAVLQGFSQSDCDAITPGSYAATVSWGGRVATPPSFAVKVYAGTSAGGAGDAEINELTVG